MAIVDGLNRVYNDIEVRKLKTDLSSIKVGDVISAKIIEKLGDRDIILRLQEGWNFRGELSEDIKNLREGLLRFKVTGFEDGKLKLKILSDGEVSTGINASDLKQLIESAGFSSKDMEIIKTLLKHNIDLNKENIDIIKSIIDFKSNRTENSVNEFVDKYLNAKGLTAKNENFDFIKNTLMSNLKTIMDMSDEEMYFFLENKIEITKENYEKFNKIFKEDGQLFKEILNLKNSKTLDENQGLTFNKLDKLEMQELRNCIKTYIESKSGETNIDNKINIEDLMKNISVKIQEKLTDKDINCLKTLNSKDILKLIAENEGNTGNLETLNKNDIKRESNENVTLNKNNVNKEIIEKDKIDVFKIINKVNNKDELEQGILNITKNMPKEKIDKLSNYINKIIDGKATKDEITEFKQIILKGDDTVKVLTTLNNKESLNIKEAISKVLEKEFLINEKHMSGDEVKDIIKSKIQEVKECIKELSKGDILKIPDEFIKQTKLFNDISKEYYYMDVPFNLNEKEYGASIIIKDNRKDGKKIDSKNVKMVITVDANIMGKVDGYLILNNDNMNITIKAFSPWNKVLNASREKLSAAIGNLGYNVLVNVEEKKEDIDISRCNDFFNDYEISVLNTLV